jgi:uncharacterized protein (DUF2384 family)
MERNVTALANAYNDVYWNRFAASFPKVKNETIKIANIPDDIFSALVGILGESFIEDWLNKELKLLDNNKAIDLLKSETGRKALKMFILSMPN